MSNESSETERVLWRLGPFIGSGGYGEVFLGLNLSTGELVAVKRVKIYDSKSAQRAARALHREINLLKDFDHPNIVR